MTSFSHKIPVHMTLAPQPLAALRWLLNAFNCDHDESLSEAKRLVIEAYEGHQARHGRGLHDSVGSVVARG